MRLFDVTIDLAEAQPCPFPFRLRREERFEGARDRLPGHARAGITYGHHHVLSGSHF